MSAQTGRTAGDHDRPTNNLTGSLLLLLLLTLMAMPAYAIQDAIANLILSLDDDPTPHAKKGTVVTQRDQPVTFLLTERQIHRSGLSQEEIDARDLYYEIVRAPGRGSLSGTPPSVTYHPEAGFTGHDSLEYRVTGPEGESATAEVTLRVNGSYTNFESGQVRPLALSEDRNRLFAVNTPDNRLEIFDVSGETPQLQASVPVGMEPVAVAVRNDSEVWVVNHLSDSVSIVHTGETPRVVRTLQVGDEPRDIVFAGPKGNRAFITSARRGQNHPEDPQLQTEGIGRASVWVYDAENLGNDLNGSPEKILTLFGDVPRGLAVTPDGETVYAAIFHSGNQTTVVGDNEDPLSATSTQYRKPGPDTDTSGLRAPNAGIIVRYAGSNFWGRDQWLDQTGKNWGYRVRFSLPDKDVFAIDAMAETPRVTRHWSGVGTTLFNMAVNPVNGDLYVSNSEARNEVRFEGKAERADLPPVTGHATESRITRISGDQVTPRHLNTHIDRSGNGSDRERRMSLAKPLAMAVSRDGRTLYTAAFSSASIGVLDTRQMTSGDIRRSEGDSIRLSDGGPAGVVLDEDRHRLYVLTRFGNRVITLDLDTREELSSVAMYSPEPEHVTAGRELLYDARHTSRHGDNSCASCHTFGDTDHLSWDLGDPDKAWFLSPNEYGDITQVNRVPANRVQHPLKGPMATQSLRGMAFAGPQHWRGDRPGRKRVGGESLEEVSFKEFNEAFPGVLGRDEELSEEEMQRFTDFAMNISYPPNPIRRLDNALRPEEADGRDFFMNDISTGLNGIDLVTCAACHALNADFQQFGTDGKSTFEGFQSPQDMKIAHLRNMYQKVGKFGFDAIGERTDHMGDQIRGFGFRHDGALDRLNHFLSADVFSVPEERMENLVDFMMVFDTGLAPIVGQQVTLRADSPSTDHARADLLVQRAGVTWPEPRQTPLDPRPECDLVVKGVVEGRMTGWFSQDGRQFHSDTGAQISEAALRQLSREPGQELTYTCTPPGAGLRMGIDRDEDGTKDGLDDRLSGPRHVSIAPEHPDAEPIIKEPDQGGFLLEGILRDMEVFPRRPGF